MTQLAQVAGDGIGQRRVSQPAKNAFDHHRSDAELKLGATYVLRSAGLQPGEPSNRCGAAALQSIDYSAFSRI
jgi:hypothetical protein